MYAISPWVIDSMLTQSPYRLPLILLAITLVLQLSITYAVCPYMLDNNYDKATNECLADDSMGGFLPIYNSTYIQTYTRAGPYFLGMIAAYWHLHPNSRPDLHPCFQTLLEYICLLILVTIGMFGAQSFSLRIKGFDGEEWNSVAAFLYASFSRVIYAGAWAYLIPFMLDKSDLPAYRPAFCCRAYLGCGFWLPFAVISYSLYVWSEFFINLMNIEDGECDDIWGQWMWFTLKILFFSILTAMATFICVERPCSNARTVFKSSHELY